MTTQQVPRAPANDAAPEPRSTERTSSVVCKGVTVRYGKTVAVDAVDFEVAAGEVLGLLGPNGAGKTSLIRALTTMLPLDAGEATVAGIDRRYPDRIRGRIGVLPESGGYPAHQSAIEFVRYHGRLYGIPLTVAHERGMHLLEAVGLEERANSRIRTFSRGMRQRLGIVRALINEPAVLFLDEPTLGLDPAGQEEVLRRIRTIATESGTTIILTSHLLDEINRVCDSVVIMHHGRVVSSGSVDEVIREAGVARSVRVRVTQADIGRAMSHLSSAPDVAGVEPVPSGPGELRVEVSGMADGVNAVAGELLSAGVSILALELDGATLNDAFLHLTGGNGRNSV